MLQHEENNIIDQRFELVEKIGGGGMAVVYRAKDIETQQEVAIKIMRQDLETDTNYVARFEEEARAQRKLSHPNIVQTYAVGWEPHYIAMELVEGETLKDVIRRQGHLTPRAAIEVTILIANALQHAHQKGVIHRDIKPQNVLVSRSGEVKVADFGLARAGGILSLSIDQAMLGSVHYLSPEQAVGNPTNAQSDVYALGVVFYEMLTGQVPFTADSPVAVASKHANEPMSFPSHMAGRIPAAVKDIVTKAMQKDLQQRYSDMDAMLADLILARKNPYGNFVQSIAPAKKDPRREQSRQAFWRILRIFSMGMLILCIAAGVFIGAKALFGKKPQIKVVIPNLVGKTFSEAGKIMTQRDLVLDVQYEESNTVDQDVVIRQNPKANPKNTVLEGETITAWVSTGPKRILIPEITGMNMEEAKNRIKQAGLILGSITQESPTLAKPIVVEQTPHSGEEAVQGDKIDIVLGEAP